MIALLDYGMGNLRSVEKALEKVGAEVDRTTDAERAAGAAGLILPGVGAFPRAMERIRELGFDEVVRDRAAAGVPVLGICLGLQLLFDSTEEGDGAEGLGLLPGPVRALRAEGLKVPHIGWAPVTWRQATPLNAELGDAAPFYFVHTFAPQPAEKADVLGTAGYGETFVCAAARDNVYGVQFHPEKSSADGLALLANFTSLCATAAIA